MREIKFRAWIKIKEITEALTSRQYQDSSDIRSQTEKHIRKPF